MKYTLIRSKRKTISITIDKEAKVIVKAPNLVSQKFIDDYVASKEKWILKNIEKMLAIAELRQSKKYEGGEIFMIFGKEYTMCISSIDKEIYVQDDKVYFPVVFLDNPKEHMIKWYKKIAKKYLTNRTLQIADQINLKPNKVKITKADRRWGSCSSKKNINFSYKLVMADKLAIDYVIIHELCHLIYMNHSSQFWDAVEHLMPKYREQKKYLKTNEFRFIL